jgi:hypothetical protein
MHACRHVYPQVQAGVGALCFLIACELHVLVAGLGGDIGSQRGITRGDIWSQNISEAHNVRIAIMIIIIIIISIIRADVFVYAVFGGDIGSLCWIAYVSRCWIATLDRHHDLAML